MNEEAVRPVVWPSQYAFTPASGDLNSHPVLSAWRSPHNVCRRYWSLYSIGTPSLKFVGLPIPKILLLFSHSISQPGDLDLSTTKRGHGSPVWWASLMIIFSFLCPSVHDLGSGTGLTDGQIEDSHQRLMPLSCWVRA